MPLFQRRVISYHSFIFSVKFFFSNIFFSERRTCLSSFDSESFFNRKLFACQELFSFFLCCFICVSAVNSISPHRSRSVNNYFQFFGNFFTVFRQRNILPSVPTSVNTFYGSFRNTFNHAFSLRIKTKVSSFAYSSEYWKSSRSKPFTSSISSICFSAR